MVKNNLNILLTTLLAFCTIYLLSENKRMCEHIYRLNLDSMDAELQMNIERMDRISEQVVFLESVSKQMWRE